MVSQDSQARAALAAGRRTFAKHLAALTDAGLLAASHQGRETRYRLTPEPLAEAMRWMAQAGSRWDERLARLSKRLADDA